jgi:hypothetical protein
MQAIDGTTPGPRGNAMRERDRVFSETSVGEGNIRHQRSDCVRSRLIERI